MYQKCDILVTGIGIYSSIGKGVAATYDSLLSKRSGVKEILHLDTIHRGKLPAAEIEETDNELHRLLGIKECSGITRATLIGMVAAKEAFSDAGIGESDMRKTGFISANSVGGMEKTELYYLENQAHNPNLREFIDSHDCGAGTEQIADFLGIKGYISTISTACSSSANSIMMGARLIKHGIMDRVVVGGTDCLTKFTLNGFNTLKILDSQACRPMDESREGLNLGEGAGYIVLESPESAKGKHIYCRLSGYGNTNDAYHQTASSPEGTGALNAMKKALKMSGLTPKDIDYINVHGTGTGNNDLSESTAINTLFGEELPKISSTKAYTGHTLGACGGVEAVFSVLAIQNDVIFPNLRFATPIKDTGIVPVTETLQAAGLTHVLSNSFGFGGNNSTLIFSKHQYGSVH